MDAHFAQCLDMHVQPTGTNVVPPWNGNVSGAAAGNQRPKYANGSPHFPHQVIVSAVIRSERDINRNRFIDVINLAPKPSEQFRHDRDIFNIGDVSQRRQSWCQQSRCHQFENGIFGAGNDNFTVEGLPALNPKYRHGAIVGEPNVQGPDRVA